MTTPTTTPARVGRERSCTQCGSTYRSPRSSSLYCSTACRMKASRGTRPTVLQSDPESFSVIGKALLKLKMAGPIGPVSRRSSEPPIYALTVERQRAFDELRFIFDRKGWGQLTEAEFSAALKADGLQAYSTDSPQAVDRKLLQGRQRAAEARLRKAA